jgi:hypothetical protein
VVGAKPRIGLREPLKRVRRPDDAVGVAVRLEDCAHQGRRAATPDARLDEVAVNALGEDVGSERLDVVDAAQTDHRVGLGRPVTGCARFSGSNSMCRTTVIRRRARSA